MMGFSHRSQEQTPEKPTKASLKTWLVITRQTIYKLNKSSTGVNLTKAVNFLKGVTEETGTAVEGYTNTLIERYN